MVYHLMRDAFCLLTVLKTHYRQIDIQIMDFDRTESDLYKSLAPTVVRL